MQEINNQNQNPNYPQQGDPNQQYAVQPGQPVYAPDYSQMPMQQQAQMNPDQNYGPRHVSFFIMFAKTFLGLCGGMFGSLILLLIFLASSSVLQPVLSPADATGETINPIFIVILMAMIFITSLISSMATPLLLSFTERLRYPRIMTAIYQIFIINLVIFAFVAPIYLTTSTTSLEFTAYAAGLQIILVATSAALIMEILNDERYPLLAVYTTIIGMLVATSINIFIYQILKSSTVLLFAALPITWASIGFFQGILAMIYYWYYLNWGNDFLASTTTYGLEYAGVAEEEAEREAEELPPDDKNGGDFLKS